jgi:hypothetical protein
VSGIAAYTVTNIREEDMLDMAALLKGNSRLGVRVSGWFFLCSWERWRFSYLNICLHASYTGCQIVLSKKLEGMELMLPQFTRNFYVDGHVPKPH